MSSGWLQDGFRMASGWLQDDFRTTQRALSDFSESTQRIFKEHLESIQREREQLELVILSEPKILRLVLIIPLNCSKLSLLKLFLYIVHIDKSQIVHCIELFDNLVQYKVSSPFKKKKWL